MPKKEYDFGGWATIYGIKCADGRTLMHGAFKGNDGQTVPIVWNHGHKEISDVIGHGVLKETKKGVYIKGIFNNTEHGKYAKELVHSGDITSLSIFANKLTQQGTNVVHGVIREVSLVLAGANPEAKIDEVLEHSEQDGMSADIYYSCEAENDNITTENIPEDSELEHSDETPNDDQPNNDDVATPNNDNVEHSAEAGKGKEETVADVFNSMSDKQKTVVYALIGQAVADAKEEVSKENKGDNKMPNNVSHNAFDDAGRTTEGGAPEVKELTHDEFKAIIEEAKKSGTGSLATAFVAHGFEGINTEEYLQHGITDVGNLFPEYKAISSEPEVISRKMGWVSKVMSAVHHTPFARVKSTAFDITADEARAKGYVKGNQKVEEVVSAIKRTTDPQTVYKLQKMDRDDVIDITDFDVLAWLKKEMRLMLDEELARAFLIGDGRLSTDDHKISAEHIRPVYGDNDVFTIKKSLSRSAGMTEGAFHKELIRTIIRARKEYKGSGNPSLYITEDALTEMLLIEDTNGRMIYESVEKLATVLRVSEIVAVEVMAGQSRTDTDGNELDLIALLVNLRDYNVGADKGGAVNMFDDFDINFNKYEYLIETRCSGALVKPYSAIQFEELKVANKKASGKN